MPSSRKPLAALLSFPHGNVRLVQEFDLLFGPSLEDVPGKRQPAEAVGDQKADGNTGYALTKSLAIPYNF